MERLIFICCLFLLLVGVAYSQYSGGSGEPYDPYQIANADDMNYMGNHPNDWDKHFIVVNDINLAGYTYTTALIAPDTNSSNNEFDGIPFTGFFDGGGHVISNFNYTGTGTDGIALFGCLDGNINDLGIEDVNIDAGTSVFVAGLVGYNKGMIFRCYVKGSVAAGEESWIVGGLVGWNVGYIFNSYASVTVAAGQQSRFIGGLIGRQESGQIFNCYTTGSVTAGDQSIGVGGLIGADSGGGLTTTNSYATVSVTAGDYTWGVGGLMGLHQNAMMEYCYAASSIMVGEGCLEVGGLVGNHAPGWIKDSFWDADIGGPNNGHGTPLSTEQMKDPNSFLDAGWDFVGEDENGSLEIWRLCSAGAEYAKLVWQFTAGDFACPDGVDMIDLKYLAGHWLDDECHPMNNHCGWTDLERKLEYGEVNLVDFSIFAGNWREGQL
jgi:hypothetical protein